LEKPPQYSSYNQLTFLRWNTPSTMQNVKFEGVLFCIFEYRQCTAWKGIHLREREINLNYMYLKGDLCINFGNALSLYPSFCLHLPK